MDEFKFTPKQEKIIEDAKKLGSGTLALPMGTGKTGISIQLSLEQNKKTKRPILVIAAKTTIGGWEAEIQKIYGDKIKYVILHPESINNFHTFTLSPDINVVITTAEVCVKSYDIGMVMQKFVYEVNEFGNMRKEYIVPESTDIPYSNQLEGFGIIHSKHWGSLIIDEIQLYTNITTKRCRAIASVLADHRWGLSGTVFDEMRPEIVLGYLLLIGNKSAISLPEAKIILAGGRIPDRPRMKTIKDTMIYRETNEDFVPPKIEQLIVTKPLSEPEAIIYLKFVKIITTLGERLDDSKEAKFQLFGLISALKQVVISPLIPIASRFVRSISEKRDGGVYNNIISELFTDPKIKDYLDDPESSKSTRIQSIIEELRKINVGDNKIVMFGTSKVGNILIEHYLKKENFTVFRILSTQSIDERTEVINKWRETKNAILLLTYSLGAEGLNLQDGNVIFLIDYWWNDGKTRQAIARVLRYGQKHPVVHIRYFTSNTSMESFILEKQKMKKEKIKDFYEGKITTKEKSDFSPENMVKIVAKDNNENIIKSIVKFK